MTIPYYNLVDQGSDEWLAMRCGILTASNVKHILTPTLKIADNDKTRAHVYEIAAQRVTKYVEPQYISDDMLRGMEDEISAKALYSEKYAPVTECGFIKSNALGFDFGYSPDGLVGEDGLIEIKSRSQKFQMETIAKGLVPAEYMLQLQAGLLVSGRKWVDFISYSAGMPMFVKRVAAIDEYQDAIAEAAHGFEAKVSEVIALFEQNSGEFFPTERNADDFDII